MKHEASFAVNFTSGNILKDLPLPGLHKYVLHACHGNSVLDTAEVFVGFSVLEHTPILYTW